MSTTTTLDLWNESSELSLSQGSSPIQRRESYAPKSISDHMLLTRISLSLPSPNKSWHQSYSSFQTSTRIQSPRVHYHPWCDECQTLTTWEQPLPTNLKCKTPIPTFGDLKMVIWEKSCYQSPSKNQSTLQLAMRKVCSTWREEQFAKAVAKRSAKMAAQEALRWPVHWQRTDCGAALPVT